MNMINKLFFKLLSYAKSAYVSFHQKQSLLSTPELKHSSYDVVLYMSGGEDTLYQYDMWGPVIKNLSQNSINILTVFRGPIDWDTLADYGDCKIFVSDLDGLLSSYGEYGVKLVLYPNNRMRNFQSLSYNNAHHVFINHGESEKSSMYSNQAKAYDSVFVAGQVALDRYRNHLRNFDEDKFICVGRPQLDSISPLDLNVPAEKKVILYAPTWEGSHSEMSYSSVDSEAVKMIAGLLLREDFFIIYKPHPSLGISSTAHRDSHGEIVKLMDASPNGVYLSNNEDILSVFHAVDFAIFDNSSVIIDYLSFEKAFCITNNFHVDNRATLPPIARLKGVLVEKDQIASIPAELDTRLASFDYQGSKELKVKYLGDLSKGESTTLFIDTVKKHILEVANDE
ncbi:CDP-glycerol glycerophosphotransferase family protein [Vibrio sp. ZSDE26]|uniref:CDP-glycerol glycerophosphotransferase family protein n=1 Tax=Vibrio amylolyticus TaxID=2847292 RepID=A0A9X1XPQ3_9VIBR|nr:CDP-glycerol glycerophosphotransferase family protein [Vibrio amylolyticus]MCK6263244.1 CDP-glycerol glycerophosphotransferase family protein [Vibrio amylolyticus]